MATLTQQSKFYKLATWSHSYLPSGGLVLEDLNYLQVKLTQPVPVQVQLLSTGYAVLWVWFEPEFC